MWRIILIACCVLWLSQEAHAAVPPCAPGAANTVWVLATNHWQIKQGTLGPHFYYGCKKPDGTVSMKYGLSCYRGKDCDYAGALEYIYKKPDMATTWNAKVEYDCNDPKQVFAFAWQAQVCAERNMIYQQNHVAWEK